MLLLFDSATESENSHEMIYSESRHIVNCEALKKYRST